ncbi:MAG: M50 family metallopeptidase [Candidatus Diapherotrites archaeon]
MPKISFHWVFFPGMIFHELSHYTACLFLGVKVRKVKLFGVEEAFVVHDKPNAWKAVIIALAPFILGSFFALIFIAFGFSLLAVLNPFGLIFVWFALALVFYSFPSLHDSKNAFDSVAEFYSKNIFKGNLFKRLFWLITLPFVFIPLILVLGIMLAFNYSSKLRLLWIVLILVFSLYPPYSERFLSYINDLVSMIGRFLLG